MRNLSRFVLPVKAALHPLPRRKLSPRERRHRNALVETIAKMRRLGTRIGDSRGQAILAAARRLEERLSGGDAA